MKLAGYRRFVAYVYEYPDGKKGDGKGFIKVEVRDGRCRMNYRVTGMRDRESVPCKIYGFVRLEKGCDGVWLGDCDLAGDNVQFQQEMPEQQLGGSHYSLNDLSGVVMLTRDGTMYGTGWDDKPVRLDEIRLPAEERQENTSADNEMTREPLSGENDTDNPVSANPVPDSSSPYDESGNEEEPVAAAECCEEEIEFMAEVQVSDESEKSHSSEDDWPFIEEAMQSGDTDDDTQEEQAEEDPAEQNEPGDDRQTDSDAFEKAEDSIDDNTGEAWEEVRETEPRVRENPFWEERGDTESNNEAKVWREEPWEKQGVSVGESMEQDDMAFHGNYAGEMMRPEPENQEKEMFSDNENSNIREDNSTWNPAGEGQEGGLDILEELDQDEDAIRHMRRVQREEEERSQSPAMEEQVRGLEAQTAKAGFYPFTDGEIVDCIQLTPGDFRMLSHRDRGLMNNNFLRHGYYRYHHVLLGKRREDGRYILGVPGVYNRQECLMAGMFGFPNFKAGKGSGPQRFGYWFRLIDTPNMDRGNRL